MTRAKRYANHAGGRKYHKETGEELAKTSTHKDAEEKLEASEIFKAVWNKCREHDGYIRRKAEFQAEQKEWDKETRRKKAG
jgi:hypothetical protein